MKKTVAYRLADEASERMDWLVDHFRQTSTDLSDPTKEDIRRLQERLHHTARRLDEQGDSALAEVLDSYFCVLSALRRLHLASVNDDLRRDITLLRTRLEASLEVEDWDESEGRR